jgi:hypothetical protein
MSGAPAPPPIMPKFKGGKLKFSEVDALEMARQLTLFESQLFQRIKSTECLQRAREQRTENNDNITNVIQTSNRVSFLSCHLARSLMYLGGRGRADCDVGCRSCP